MLHAIDDYFYLLCSGNDHARSAEQGQFLEATHIPNDVEHVSKVTGIDDPARLQSLENQE
jgi:hypothetical protein